MIAADPYDQPGKLRLCSKQVLCSHNIVQIDGFPSHGPCSHSKHLVSTAEIRACIAPHLWAWRLHNPQYISTTTAPWKRLARAVAGVPAAGLACRPAASSELGAGFLSSTLGLSAKAGANLGCDAFIGVHAEGTAG